MLKASKGVVTPIVPTVIAPLPLRRVKLSVSLPSALIVLVAKSIFPSLAVPVTSLVIVMAPSIVTAPSKSISPTPAGSDPVPAVVIFPFKTIEVPSRLTSSIVVPLPIPPVPTVVVPVVVRVTFS